jgi:Fur family transcriptional regulator, ferric uptake regulator
MYEQHRIAAGARVVRKTCQRDAISRVLKESSRFRTAQEIHAEMRSAGERIGLTTVYRHLQLLAEDGTVHTLQLDGRQVAYRWCSSRGHHHHLVCRECGAGVELTASELEPLFETIVAEEGYSDVSHVLEVFGVCPECQVRARSAALGPGTETTREASGS